MPDAAYYRRWRAAHPEYRQRERARAKARQRTPEQRRAERERARARQEAQRKSDAYERWVKPWRRANAERHREQQRRANARSFEKDPERKREWRRAAARRARDRRYEALARGAVDALVSPDRRALLHDALYEDALATALLSLLENRYRRNAHYSEADWVADAREAARQFIRSERRHRVMTAGDFDKATGVMAA